MDPTALKYRRILASVYSSAWAMQPRRLADVLDVLDYQSTGGKLTADEIRAYVGIGAAAGQRTEDVPGGVRVIGLRGIISHRAEMMDDMSGPGGTSVERFTGRLRDAMADRSVGAIVIDIDSPGGSVDGVTELASELRAARDSKPIIAVANTLAASAAYWIGSQASELVVTPSGEVGSIGVFAAHRDISKALEAEGETVTLVHAGKYKVEGNPYEPLSDDARAELQGKVDAAYAKFLSAVAVGRGVTVDAVAGNYGQGRTLDADAAVAAGMADSIETLDQVIARVRGKNADARRRAHAARERAIAFA